ncbi:MAG: peptide-methionine (S)-S-oxide reductase MsrA [Verrucomicrobiota bacterium]
MSTSQKTATLGAGCFWCVEAVILRLPGVLKVTSGYMGGELDEPTYEAICTGQTGHAEVIQIDFDPVETPFEKLLDYFWQLHDPTTLNRQGNDRGTQYRSAIFYHDDDQRETADRSKEAAASLFSDPIVTEITEASVFWPAEEYHQDFFRRNPTQPYCCALIPPKLAKLGLPL